MNNAPLIIENPELQSTIHRYGWGSVTFIFWVIYIYLWLPLITLLAWWLGVKLFNVNMIRLDGYKGLMSNLAVYSIIIVVVSLILVGWAEIERMRFKDKARRQVNDVVTVEEVAEKHNMNVQELAVLRQKKSMLVHFSVDGHISKINEYNPVKH